MGVDYSIYVGPYVICDIDIIKVKKTKRSCTEKSCNNYGHTVYDLGSKFCYSCGASIREIEFPQYEDSVDQHDIVENILRERLFQPLGDDIFDIQKENKKHYYLPNMGLKTVELLDIRHNYSSINSVSIKDIEDQINAFQTEYDNEIKLLKKHYNDKVVIEWGIINQVW